VKLVTLAVAATIAFAFSAGMASAHPTHHHHHHHHHAQPTYHHHHHHHSY
jgi:Spy/CpxP family protein refolding chaperone